MRSLAHHPIVALLRTHAVYRRLWIGAMISAIGDNLAWIAMSWFVLQRGGDGRELGLVLLCLALPAAITATPIGRLMDRLQPRRVMLVDSLARGAVYLAIPLLYWLGALSTPLLLLLALISGALAPAWSVGVRVLPPALLDRRDHDAANAALALTQQLPIVIAPVLGGFVSATLGAADAIALNGLSFFALALALLGIPDVPRHAAPERAIGRINLLLPLRWPRVAAVLALNAMLTFSYGPTEVALPLYTRDVLRAGPDALGLMWSIFGVGTLFGALLTERLGRLPRRAMILLGLALGWGMVQILFGLSVHVPMLGIVMLAGGVIWGPYLALEAGLIQREVPAELHGSVFGVRTALMVPAAPVGAALGGLLLSAVTSQQLIIASGLMCVLFGLLLLPVIRRA